MSKLESISRYSLIVNRLQKRPSSLKEILEYLERESEFQERDFSMSKRTFQRDVKEIFELFKIEITFNRSSKKYELIENEHTTNINRLLETFDLFNTLNLSERMQDYIQFEKRKPQGTEHIQSLLKMIKDRKVIQFQYQKFWEDKISTRTAKPYLLKEFRNRWYLVAKDLKDDTIKTFGMDRLSKLKALTKTFKYPEKDVIKNKFKHSFGVITPSRKPHNKIVLSFHPDQAKYIKTLPLHHSQKIDKETDKECIFSFELHATYDFIQEILSFGSTVKVLEPQSLINEIKETYAKSARFYK